MAGNDFTTTRTILRRKEVEARTGLCRSSIYAKMQAGLFPRSVELGPKSVGWYSDEIESWMDSLRRRNDSATHSRVEAS